MAGNRRRKQGNSGVRTFLYILVVLVLLGGMGYLFYYSRSQAKERQEYIRELESKEAATKGWVQVTQPEEPESETEAQKGKETKAEAKSETESEIESESESESEIESETQTEGSAESEENLGNSESFEGLKAESETESRSENESVKSEASESFADAEGPKIIVLNGTGKAGVAAYWKRFLQAKGLTNIVMADYKGEVKDSTVVYVTAGGDAPEGVYSLFPNAEYREGGLDSVDPDVDTNVKVPDSQKKFDSYDVWIVVGNDDALHD